MEDDDEFGDLYADVLPSFTTPFTSQPQEPKDPVTNTTSFQGRRQVDLNGIDSDDDDILFGASNSNNSNAKSCIDPITQQKTLSLQPKLDTDMDPVTNWEVDNIEDLAGVDEKGGKLDSEARVLDKNGGVILRGCSFSGSNFMDEGDINIVVEEREDTDDFLVEKDGNLVGASENLAGEEGAPMIPGLSLIPGLGLSGGLGDRNAANFDEEDDSDSEDDLQIVLNSDNEFGSTGMERMGGVTGEEDDEDGDPLVIVADNGNMGHPPLMNNQEWGEEAGASVDGERKELGDVAVPPKTPFGVHTYHNQFHSQFKYVRPNAPIPGAAPAGPGVPPGQPPGQMRPPVNTGFVAGRGRGDWRPAGIKGYGAPVWGNNSTGRGLDFTLPSHKTIFEVDIDSFEDKPWKIPGIEISHFFNFDMNEESWKDFCKQLEQRRLETTMQSRIRVYESGRTEQEYDPDLPPELAAASGVQEIFSDNANIVKTDARIRPPLPTGRPIQVETNYTDRVPSIDARQPRVRDSDSIIEIVCEVSSDEDSPEKDMAEQQDHEISREEFKGADEIDDLSQANDNSSRKKEFEGQRGHFLDRPGSRERTPEATDEELVVENKVTILGESSKKEIKDITSQDDMLKDKNLFDSSEKQKVEQSSQENEKAAKSSENSQARSASSKDYRSREGKDTIKNPHVKTDSIDRRREIDRALHRSGDKDLHMRSGKREYSDEIDARQRNRDREGKRSEKDEVREHFDNNGSRRVNHDLKRKDRDDGLKRRYENMDYPYNKRRKDDSFMHGHRESSGFHKRERDDVSDQWKRDEVARLRNDEIYNARRKEEGMFQIDISERQRDQEEWHRSKQPRGKPYDRENEQPKRRNRLDNESLVHQKGREDLYTRGNDERRERHERVNNTREDRTANESEKHKLHERKHREYSRKGKELEINDRKSPALYKKNQDDMASLKGKMEQRSNENEVQVSKKHKEEKSSDDENSTSMKGRSKLERWASHKEEKESNKSSSSLQIKEVVSAPKNEPSKPMIEEKEQKSKEAPEMNNNVDANKHLDTVERLKKRSERFKVPLPSEKESMVTKKTENETVPSTQSEIHQDTTEIKPERPARKRRWTSNL